MVPGVGDVDQGASAIGRNTLGLEKPCAAAAGIGVAIIASRAGERGDHSGRRDFSYGEVASVSHIDNAVGIHRHSLRLVEPRAAAGAVAAAADSR